MSVLIIIVWLRLNHCFPLSQNQSEKQFFLEQGTAVQNLKLASRPVLSRNDLLMWYISRVNKKLSLDMCYNWFASGKVWVKNKVKFLLNFIQKCGIKDHSWLMPVPHLQPGKTFLNSSPSKWLPEGCLKMEKFFHNSWHYQYHYQSMLRKQCFISKQSYLYA